MKSFSFLAFFRTIIMYMNTIHTSKDGQTKNIWFLTASNQKVLQSIKKSFQDAHLDVKVYWILTDTLQNSKTTTMLSDSSDRCLFTLSHLPHVFWEHSNFPMEITFCLLCGSLCLPMSMFPFILQGQVSNRVLKPKGTYSTIWV